MLRHPTQLSRLSWLAAPLLAFAGLLAVLALADGSPELSASGPAGDGADRPSNPGDTSTLIESLREAAGADPEDAQTAVALGDAYYQRSRETGDASFYARADRAYEAALASEPDNVAAISGQATIALARHQFADGLELARRAHRAEPDLVAPYAALVDGLIENGRYARAGQALERMVALKPNLAAYSRISYFRELHGDLRGASRALRAAVSAGAGTIEGSAYIRSLLGDFEASRGRYVAAERAYRAALAIDPGYGGPQSGLALLRAGAGKLGAAIVGLREQVGDPPSPDALVELGEVEQAAGRLAAARRHYAQAGDLERQLLTQGSGYDAGVTLNEAEHGDPARAVGYGRRAWRTSPSVSSADAYSWALYRAGRIDAATRLSAEAMRLGSRDPEFLYHAGMIAKAGGRDARAERLLETLLEQAPRFSPLYAPRAERALEAVKR
jgi:tetratricopeptide (TPR) repeat protein